MRMRWCPL